MEVTFLCVCQRTVRIYPPKLVSFGIRLLQFRQNRGALYQMKAKVMKLTKEQHSCVALW